MTNAKGTKRVEVAGKKWTVNTARLESWTAAKLIASISANDDDESKRAAYAIQLLDYVLGDEMDKVAKACGGADARAEDVINLGYEILTAASKN